MRVNRPYGWRQCGGRRGAGVGRGEAMVQDAGGAGAYQRRGRGEGRFPRPGRGGRGNYRGANQQAAGNERMPQQIRPISFQQLLELSEKPPAEILLTIQNEVTGFQTLVNHSIRMEETLLVHVLRIVSKACRSVHCRNNLVAFLGQFLSSRVVSEHLPTYLTRVHHLQNFGVFLATTLEYLVVFFKASLDLFPTRASDKLETCIFSCQTTVQAAVAAGHGPNEETRKLIAELETMRDRIVEEHRRSEQRAKEGMTNENVLQIVNPPNDFRTMSIVPTIEELHGLRDVYLRPNVVSGRYPNGENYLDTQFRLLREDFISTLRDGIVRYRALMQSLQTAREETARHLRTSMRDLRIYYNVQLVDMSSTYGGVVYVLQLDLTRLKNVRWENTKRLLTGSLLCLSPDNFDTIVLASVVQRQPEKLKKGLIGVRFVEGHRLNTGRNARGFRFLVVESTTYFEAYRPILKTLQGVDGAKLPLGKYIIEMNTDVSPPKYLRRNTTYKMDSLLPNKAFYKSGTFAVLDDDAWPDEREFELDKAQYRALKSALTRELAIIQGPPGTGKTYIGLKIVQALLVNRDVWMSQRPNPILVVCFTNHALDQFLEGVINTTKNVVRVGGRSKSEFLLNYNLRSVKDNHVRNRTVPRHLHLSSWTIRSRLKEMGALLAEHVMKIARARSDKGVVRHQELQNFMTPAQNESLDEIRYEMGTKSAVFLWLSQGMLDVDMQPNPEEVAAEVRQNPVAPAEDDEEIDDQGDMDEEAHHIEGDDRAFEPIAIVRDEEEDFDDVRRMGIADGWQVQGGRKRMHEAVQRQLRRTDAMDEAAARAVRDIWRLEARQRWRLYRYWVQRLVDHLEERLHEIEQEYETLAQQLNEVELEEDIQILREAHVVGMTTTGAAKYQVVLREIRPQIVIVEEAAEVLEAHITTSLTEGCEHLILIGDHQQLRPNPTVYELASRYNLDISLFERFLKNRVPYERLGTQHRMRPSIAQLLVPNIYESLNNDPSVEDYGHIPGIEKDVFFLLHESKEQQTRDTTSKENLFEAEFIVGLCRHVILQGINPEKITILTTYVGQMFVIKRLMKAHFFTGVRVTVVDNYQGEENDVILLSLVRSNEEGKVGFLKVSNRICVALSRARMGLYCIGNFNFLAENAEVWRPIICTLKTNGMIGQKMRLVCQNHPTIATEVSCGKDFEKVPEGGCQQLCEFRLSCGHQCPKVCHILDLSHKDYRCNKPCPKIICKRGHQCSNRCFEDCTKMCKVMIELTLPICLHLNKIQCSEDPFIARCKAVCNKLLSCGHPCKSLCGKTCVCDTMVSVRAVCGHTVRVKCADSGNEQQALKVCNAPCGKLLSCNHRCAGTCSRCHQGRFHVACQSKCGRTLVCGHECRVACASLCPPCKEKCQNRCLHSRCQSQCGIPCVPCQEPCPWQCVHHECSKRCGEMCDRPPCNEPCPVILECGHPCIGLCGDTCPDKCGICNANEVHEIFFGDEDEDDARFVLLEDCKHLILASAMDTWMNTEQDGKTAIKPRECPKCKTVIRKNLRYGNMIKESLQDISNVKQRFFTDLWAEKASITRMKFVTHVIELKFQKAAVKLRHSLERTHIPGAEYFILQNVVAFLEKMVTLGDETRRLYAAGRDELNSMLYQLEVWICDVIPVGESSGRCGSEQQITQLGCELQRAISLYNLHSLVNQKHDKRLNDRAQPIFDNALRLVNAMQEFDQTMEETVSVALREIKQLETGLNISEEERVQIVKAMGMSTGHWFKCPNGHVYIITECGGAMQEGVCNECQARIGGGSHRLRSDNAMAPEMDGARTPAYPTMLM